MVFVSKDARTRRNVLALYGIIICHVPNCKTGIIPLHIYLIMAPGYSQNDKHCGASFGSFPRGGGSVLKASLLYKVVTLSFL